MTDQMRQIDFAERVGGFLTGSLAWFGAPMRRLRTGASWRPKRRDGGEAIWLAAPEHRHSIDCEVLDQSPGEARVEEALSLLRELVEDDDWLAVSELLGEWDDTRERPVTRALYDLGLDCVIDCIADGYYEPSYCMPFWLPRYDDTTVARQHTLAATNPENPVLAAIASRIYTHLAWLKRGGEEAVTIDPETWDAVIAHIDRSEALCAAACEKNPNSALLAHVRLGWLPFRASNASDVRDAFEDLARYDPESRAAIETFTYLHMPRWFGLAADFDSSIRAAARYTRDFNGMAHYAAAYLFAMIEEEATAVTLDTDLFARALDDLIESYGRDPAEVARIFEALRAIWSGRAPRGLADEDLAQWELRTGRLRQISQDFLVRHLTAIVPSAWSSESAAFDAISAIFQAELAQGENLLVDADGISVIRPQ